MSDASFVDANVLLRFLTRDDPATAARCRQLLLDAAAGSRRLECSSLAFAEIVWVLEKVYKWPRQDIAPQLTRLLELPGLEFREQGVLRTALAYYRDLNVDFIDAYQASLMAARGVSRIYSYDRDFDRLPEIDRLEP